MAKKLKPLDVKAKFNLLANAQHIFTLASEKTPFTLVELVKTGGNCKAVIIVERSTTDEKTGEFVTAPVYEALFTNSPSAIQSLEEVIAVFGDERPEIVVEMVETANGKNVYRVQVA